MRAKKVIVGVAISAMLISSSIPVMAFSVTNGNKTFDKKWELSTTSDGGKGVLTYGYNTLAINEDYAHAYHSTKRSLRICQEWKWFFFGFKCW